MPNKTDIELARGRKLYFASDNASIKDSRIAQAGEAAVQSVEFDVPYGNDRFTIAAVDRLSEIHGRTVYTGWFSTGTIANTTAIATLCTDHFGKVLCSDVAHIAVDEEDTLVRLVRIPVEKVAQNAGKINVAEITKHLVDPTDIHQSKISVVSITQPTEKGTVYTVEEINSIVDFCHQRGIKVHVDCARGANAAYVLQKDLGYLAHVGRNQEGVDAISFGVTKAGADGVDVVVVFDEKYDEELQLWNKLLGLQSKNIRSAGQVLKYLERQGSGKLLAEELAEQMVGMSSHISSNLDPEIPREIESQTNMNWPMFSPEDAEAIQKVFYLHGHEVRLPSGLLLYSLRAVCGPAVTLDMVDEFYRTVNRLWKARN